MSAYYNEIDPLKAEILREAIKAGAIALGDVDERSIKDVEPAGLLGYTQCHFFAGGGFWSLALRQAGWPDDQPVWTGSCPCPSFSVAGQGQGFRDPRHLWPDWMRLIRECHPAVIFGEQVGAAIGHGWLDLVQADLETETYAVGKIVFGACSVGAPHIRQRLYFVAQPECTTARRWGLLRPRKGGTTAGAGPSSESLGSGADCGLADAGQRYEHHGREMGKAPRRLQSEMGAKRIWFDAGDGGDASELDHSKGRGLGMCGSAPGQSGHAAQPSELGDLGDTDREGLPDGQPEELRGARWPRQGRTVTEPSQAPCGLANADGGNSSSERKQRGGQHRQQPQDNGTGGLGESESQRRQLGPMRDESNGAGMEPPECQSEQSAFANENAGGMADAELPERRQSAIGRSDNEPAETRWLQSASSPGECGEIGRPGPLNGWWRDADWIGCRDGKFRPVKSGTFPLAAGYPCRVGILRLAGDAICVPAAQTFIEAYLETQEL